MAQANAIYAGIEQRLNDSVSACRWSDELIQEEIEMDKEVGKAMG